MVEPNKREIRIRFSAIGCSAGLLIAILIYALLFRGLDISFTLGALGQLHGEINLLYIVDSLPLLTLAAGWITGRTLSGRWQEWYEAVERDRRKSEEIRRFVHSLIAGNLNATVSFPEMDPALSAALNQLKDSLVRNREIERQRRLDERQRNWISEGLAEFGDILRTKSQELESMAYAVVSGMVKYLDANQGAFFLAEEEAGNRTLRMIACHAYDRRKYPDKRIKWGDGLIGDVAMEKKGYYTDKIPDGYLTITSGLGKANPNYLLIEPLVWNNQVFGILEIASFKPLEDYKLQFVSRVAENVATTINTMESNLRTGQLLKETRAQAEQLARQEEQVRQNMEALKRAQEEAAEQADIFIRFTNTVNHTLMRAEYNTDGRLIYANTRFLKKLGYAGNREVEGKHISMFINEKDRVWFDELWEKLSRGGRHFEGYMKHETKMGQDLWTMATYTCMRRDDGSVEKILFLAIDSTEQKKQSLDYESQISALDRLNAKAVFAPGGRLQLSNELFRKILKYTDMELEQMNVFDFFSRNEQERFSEIWEKAVRGEPFQGQLKMLSKYEEELWFRATLLSADDIYGEVEKVIFLASEITKEKEMELAAHSQRDQLIRKEEDLRLAGLDLERKLEETNRKRQEDAERFRNVITRLTDVLEEIPFPVITINNRGFVLLFNRGAEKIWGLKRKHVLEKQVRDLFPGSNGSAVIKNFSDPARSKTPGTYPSQKVILPGNRVIEKDLLVVRTDLEDEMIYTMVML